MADVYIDVGPNVVQLCDKYFEKVTLDLLDKVTSKIVHIDALVGEKFKIGGLVASVEVCSFFCTQKYNGYGALLNISRAEKGLFSNWVFGKYPGILFPVDIRYDINLIKCE